MDSLSSYTPKILLALGEAVSGNAKIRDWLMKNNFLELGLFCYAIRNSDEAREWLLKNGYAHFMALINAGEGNMQALKWLLDNDFIELYYMALAIDNDEPAEKWVMMNCSKEMVLLTQKIQFVKNKIEEDNNNFHKFNNT